MNVLLAVGKLGVGAVANSASLIADGWHSFSDLASDVLCAVAVKLGARPADAGVESLALAGAGLGGASMPAGMPGNPEYHKIDPSQAPIMGLALSSPNLSPSELYDIGSTILAQKIAQISGVGEVSVGGASLPAVRVQLDAAALMHYGISLDEVRSVISSSNALRPMGVIEEGSHRWQVQTSEALRTAVAYRNLIVRYQDGAAVRLGDVAQVTDSVENRYSAGFHNDRAAVILSVSRQSGANIVETVANIHERLPQLYNLIPSDAELTIISDRSPVIRATLREAQISLLVAALLVVIVVWLFLGNLRAALIPSTAIPVSLIGSFVVMYLCGFSLNNLSLMALIVGSCDGSCTSAGPRQHRERSFRETSHARSRQSWSAARQTAT